MYHVPPDHISDRRSPRKCTFLFCPAIFPYLSLDACNCYWFWSRFVNWRENLYRDVAHLQFSTDIKFSLRRKRSEWFKTEKKRFFLFLQWIKRIQDWKRQPIKIQFPDKKKKWFWRKNVFEFNRFQRVFHSIFQLILSRASIELVLTKLWLHTKWWTTWNWVWSVAIDFKALLSPPFRCFTADFHVCARQTHYEKCAHFVMCRLAIYAHSIHNNDCIRVPARAIVVAAVRMYACSNCISEQIANRRVSW